MHSGRTGSCNSVVQAALGVHVNSSALCTRSLRAISVFAGCMVAKCLVHRRSDVFFVNALDSHVRLLQCSMFFFNSFSAVRTGGHNWTDPDLGCDLLMFCLLGLHCAAHPQVLCLAAQDLLLLTGLHHPGQERVHWAQHTVSPLPFLSHLQHFLSILWPALQAWRHWLLPPAAQKQWLESLR